MRRRGSWSPRKASRKNQRAEEGAEEERGESEESQALDSASWQTQRGEREWPT